MQRAPAERSDRQYRRSIRLKGYDYSQAGAYFATICTRNRKCSFGKIVNGEMVLNDAGKIVRAEWLRTGDMRPNVELDAFVIMPNHIHGIIIIHDGRGTLQRAPTVQRAPAIERFGKPTSNSIPTIVRLFKSAVTKRINGIRHSPGARLWQRNYYEHIIRNEESLQRIREYIIINPLQWEYDRENPNAGTGFKPASTEDETWRV